jgi:hypothetical protein
VRRLNASIAMSRCRGRVRKRASRRVGSGDGAGFTVFVASLTGPVGSGYRHGNAPHSRERQRACEAPPATGDRVRSAADKRHEGGICPSCVRSVRPARLPARRPSGTTAAPTATWWHNTRHSAVTNLTNAGVLRHEAKTVSGHTTDEVFNRYSIGTEQPQRAALGTGTLYTEQFEADRLSFPSPTAPTLPIRRPESSPE